MTNIKRTKHTALEFSREVTFYIDIMAGGVTCRQIYPFIGADIKGFLELDMSRGEKLTFIQGLLILKRRTYMPHNLG